MYKFTLEYIKSLTLGQVDPQDWGPEFGRASCRGLVPWTRWRDDRVPVQKAIRAAFRMPERIAAAAKRNVALHQVPDRRQTGVPTTQAFRKAARQRTVIRKAQGRDHCTVNPHYSGAAENRDCQRTVAPASKTPREPARPYTGVSWTPAEALGIAVLPLESQPPPADPGRATVPGSPPAARKTNCRSLERSFGAPSRAAVPSRSWPGPPGWLAAWWGALRGG